MKTVKTKLISSITMLSLALIAQSTSVRFETNLGNIDIELYDEEAPITVQNFLNYVNDGDFDENVFQRSVPGFVLQGGGYIYNGGSNFQVLPTDPPITNEAGISNLAGTIAMARTSSPNSATNQWFFNLVDNTNLNPAGGEAGYAVFGKVIRGMEVVKTISSLQRLNFSSSNIGSAASTFPVYEYVSGGVTLNNVVKINRAYQLSEQFQVTAGLSGAYYNPATDGQGIYLEVLPDISKVIMAWFTYDTAAPDDLTTSEIGYAGGRWLTAVGDFDGNVFSGTVYESSGGLFENGVPVSNTPVGTVTLTFNSCFDLVMNYSLYNASLNGMNNLQRIAGSNVALCEQMAIEANQGDN